MGKCFSKRRVSGTKLLTQIENQLHTTPPESLFCDLTISNEWGVLAMNQKGFHEFLTFEYLTPTMVENEWERSVERIDFGPKENLDRVVGEGKITRKKYKGETEIVKALKEMNMGPKWKVQVSKFFPVLKDVEKGIEEGNVPIYSSAGDSIQSSRDKKVENCFTFARDFILKYKTELGIIDSEQDLNKTFNLKWLPIQLPNHLNSQYRKNQQKTFVSDSS